MEKGEKLSMFIKLVHRDTLSVEADVKRIQGGDLLLVCTCGGLSEPAAENRTVCFRSNDNGRTWTEKRQICEENGLAHYHTETAVLGDSVRIFISEHNGKFIGWKNYFLESSGKCLIWKKYPLTELPKYAFVRGMVTLSNKNIVFPYHSYPITEEMEKECLLNDSYVWKNRIPYIESGLLVSENDGKTFKRKVAFQTSTEQLLSMGLPGWIWPENTVTEAENGHLIMLFRVDRSGFLWRADSYDYGNHWSVPQVTDIPNPSNKPRLFRSAKGEIILVNTPKSEYGLDNRFPLEVWLSKDGMRSWDKKIRVSDFPGAYSYASGFIEDDRLYLAFEFNRHDIYFAVVNLRKD